MEKKVKKKSINENLSDVAGSIRNALGWKEEEAVEDVEVVSEDDKKKKAKSVPRKAFSDFAASYRKEIGK